MNNENKFDYTYSAPTEAERREIESIKKQYLSAPDGEDRMEELRGLNKRVTQPPLIICLIIGIIGTLIFGTGMCFAMQVIGTSLLSPKALMAVGVIIGCLGIVVCIANFFLYKALLKRNKRKYGKKIIQLSNELLNEK